MAEDTTTPLTDEEMMSQLSDEEIAKQLETVPSQEPASADAQAPTEDSGNVVDPESGATMVPVPQEDGSTLYGAVEQTVTDLNTKTGDAINNAYNWLENLGTTDRSKLYDKPVDGETPIEGAGRMAANTWKSLTQDPYGALVNTAKSATQIGHNLLQEGTSIAELSIKMAPLTRLAMTGQAIIDTAKAGEFKDPIKALSQGVLGRLNKSTFSQDIKIPQLQADLQPQYEGHHLVDELGTFLVTSLLTPASKITKFGKVVNFLANSAVEGSVAQAIVSTGQGKDAAGMVTDQATNFVGNVALGGAAHLVKAGFGAAGKYFSKAALDVLQKGEEAAIRVSERMATEMPESDFAIDLRLIDRAAQVLSDTDTRIQLMEGPQGQEVLAWFNESAKHGRRSYDVTPDEKVAILEGLYRGFTNLTDEQLIKVEQWLDRANKPIKDIKGSTRRRVEAVRFITQAAHMVDTLARKDIELNPSGEEGRLYQGYVYEGPEMDKILWPNASKASPSNRSAETNITATEKAAASLDDILPNPDAMPISQFEIKDTDIDSIVKAINTKDSLSGTDAETILADYLNPNTYRNAEDLVTVLTSLSDKITAKVKASPFPMKNFRETVADHISYLNGADPNGNLGDQLLQVAANNKDAMAKVLAAKTILEGLSKASTKALNKINKASLESGILTPAEQAAMRDFLFYRDAFAGIYGPHKVAMSSASALLRSYGRKSVMSQVKTVEKMGTSLDSVLGASDAELSLTKDTPLLDALSKKTAPKKPSTPREMTDEARMIAYLAKDAIEKQRNTNILFAVRDKAVRLWVNGLLSHWITQAINVTGTALNVYRKPVDLFFGGEADLAWKILVNQTYMLKPGLEAGITNFLKKGDGLGGTSLISDSLSEDTKSLLEALAPSGITADNPALAFIRKAGAAIDRVVGAPGDAMKAEDEVFKYITAGGNTSARLMQHNPTMSGAQARAEAAKMLQTLTKDAKDLTEADLEYLTSNYAVITESINAAHKATFTSPIHKDEGGVDTFLGFPAQVIKQAKNSNNFFVSTLAQTVFPFVGTPTNILQQSYDSTFLRLLDPRFYQALQRGGREAAEARGAMITGTGMMLGFIGLAANGVITGSGPINAEARQHLKETGWQPNSITWKDEKGTQHYLNLSRIEPFGTLLSLSADLYSAGTHATRGEYEEIAPILAATFINTLSNKKMLKGLVDLNTFLDRAPDDPVAIEAMLGSIASSSVPNFMRMFDNDPNVRLIRNRLDAAYAKIPGMSDQLPLSYDALGRPRIEHVFGLYSKVKDEALNSLIQEDIAGGGVGLGVLNHKTASGEDLTAYINKRTGRTAYQEVAYVLSNMVDKYGIRDEKGALVESTLEEYLAWADRHPEGDLSVFPHPDPNNPGQGMQFDDTSERNISTRMMAIKRVLNKARTRAIGYVMDTQGATLVNPQTGKSLYASHLKEQLGRSLMDPIELEFYRGEVSRLEDEKRAAEEAASDAEPVPPSETPEPSPVQEAQDRSNQVDNILEGN